MSKNFKLLAALTGILLVAYVSANAAVISDVKVCNLTGRGADITWLTDVAATGEDSVRVTNTSVSLDTVFTASRIGFNTHSVGISGLTPSTADYVFQIISEGATTSADTFATPAEFGNAPQTATVKVINKDGTDAEGALVSVIINDLSLFNLNPALFPKLPSFPICGITSSSGVAVLSLDLAVKEAGLGNMAFNASSSGGFDVTLEAKDGKGNSALSGTFVTPIDINVNITTLQLEPPTIPIINVSPASLNFGLVEVTNSKRDTVTFQNIGEDTLDISGLLDVAAPFRIISPGTLPDLSSPILVPPNSTIEVVIECSPTTTGSFLGTLVVISNDSTGNAILDIPLSGTGLASDIEVSPTNVDYGVVLVGNSLGSTIKIKNLGNANLVLGALSLTGTNAGEFSIQVPPSSVVGQGDSTEATIRFSPTSGGTKNATLVIPNNDPDAADGTVFVALIGVGGEPNITVVNTVDFGSVSTIGAPKDIDLEILSDGGLQLAISAVVLTRPGAAAYTLLDTLDGVTLPALTGKDTLGIRFAPTSVGPFTADLTIFSDDPDTPAKTVTLLGTGIEPDIDAAPFDFGPVEVDSFKTDTLTVNNVGTDTLNVSSMTLVSGTSVTFDMFFSSPVAIAPGESFKVGVQFTPQSVGTFTDTVVVVSNDPDGAFKVPLIGEGVGVPPPSAPQFGEPFTVTLTGVDSNTTILANPGEEFFIESRVSEVTQGIFGFSTKFGFDPNVVELVTVFGQPVISLTPNVLPLNPTPSGGLVFGTTDTLSMGAAASIGIGATPVSGTILTIKFRVKSTANPGDSSPLNLVSAVVGVDTTLDFGTFTGIDIPAETLISAVLQVSRNITGQSVVDDVKLAPTRTGATVTYGGATLGIASVTGPVSVLRVVLESDVAGEGVDTVRVNINRVDVGVGIDNPSTYIASPATDATLSGVAIYRDDGDNVFEREVDTPVNAASIAFTDTIASVSADSILTITLDFPDGVLPINPNPLTFFIVVRGGAGISNGDQFTFSTNLSDWVFSGFSRGSFTATSAVITGDVSAPTISAGNAVTVDDDSDGLLDGLKITWSESIADMSFANFASATANFDVTAGTTLIDAGLAADPDGDDGTFTAANRLPKIDPNGPPRTSDTINNNITFITFITFQEDPGSPADKLLSALNTEAAPALSMAGATVTDLAGNPPGAIVGFASIDAARPVVYQSLYLDADVDGKIDEVQVQFSEDIDAATFADNDGWSVAGFAFSSNPVLIGAAASVDPPVSPTGGAFDVARLLLTEKADFNTSIDPAVDQVTYSAAAADVADLAGVALNNVFVGTSKEVDKASPILIDATTKDVVSTEPRGQIDRYTIRFTEAVNLAAGDFVILDDFNIAGLGSGAGTSTVDLTITEAGVVDTGIKPGLAVNIANVEDNALNRLGQVDANSLVAPSADALPGTGEILIPDSKRFDGAPPLIRKRGAAAVGGDAVVTGDSNRDGRLDQIVVEFTEIMPVGGDYVTGATIEGLVISGASRTAADQVTYTLTVAAGDPPNTDAVPDYLYSTATGAILDPAGLELVDIGSADITEVDGAAPVLVGAVTDDADGDGKIDKYVITVSEPISIAGVADSLRAGLGVAGHLDTLATLDATKEIITLLFVETAVTTLGDFDTGVTPEVTYTRATVQDVDGEIKDLSGPGGTASIPMEDITADNAVLTETDGARPVTVLAADDTSSTGDRNSDGFIDQFTVTFSEPVTADSGNIGITVDATASGNTVTLSEVLSGGGTNVVVFGGTSDGPATSGDPDTEDTPLFDYIETGSIRDISAAENTLRAAADQITIDEAKPVIVFATGRVQDTELKLKFSEAVRGTGAGGDVAVPDLSYLDVSLSRAGSIVAVEDEAAAINGDDELITVSVDSSFIIQDVVQDSISFSPSVADSALSLVTDAASVPNQALAILVTISVPKLFVTLINPTSGTQLGGKSVAILGGNFQSGATVTFGDTSATNVVVASPDTVTAATPAHPVGNVDVIVTNPDGQADTLFNGFTFVLLGDVSGNGEITAFDAALVLKSVVGLFVISDTVAADVSGDGTISAFDASLILRFVVGKITQFPAQTGGISKAVLGERIISLGNIKALQDRRFAVPILIDETDGVLSGQLELSLDPTKLKAVDATVSDLTSDYLLAHNAQNGRIRLSFAGVESVNGSGSIAEIIFEPIGSEIDVIGEAGLISAQLNEGLFSVIISQHGGISDLPDSYSLHQNFPNPFNPETVIHYYLPLQSHVDISVYNITGQKVVTLVDNQMDTGSHSAVWNGEDDNGESLASGVYLYRMETDGFVKTRKLVLMK